MEVKSREKLLIIVVASCLALYLGDLFLVEPLIGAWKSNNVQIAKLNTSIQNGHKLLAQDKVIQANWNEFTRRSLPPDRSDAASMVLNAFQKWKMDSRLNVTQYQPDWRAPKRGDTQTEYEVRVTGQGPLETIMRFLYDLETDPLAINVSELTIINSDPNGRNLTMTVRFTGLLLKGGKEVKEPPAAGKVSSNVIASLEGRVAS